MSIFIVRHGETASNAARIVQTPDIPLSERGLAQAERVARRLAGHGIARILTSDYARARMTAERIRDATGAPLDVEPTLRERHFGDIRGRAYAELGDIMAPDYEPPGGETWETFHRRVDGAWERIRQAAVETQGHLAVVTHGLVCGSLLLNHLGPGAIDAPDLRFGNTSITIADQEAPWTVRRVACLEHLDAARADDGSAISGI